MEFENKVILVTGGSRGIGRETVETFLQEGAYVAAVSTGIPDWSKEYDNLLWLTQDVRNSDETIESVKQVFEKWGRIDVLVNNAGITKDGFCMRMKDDDWQDVMNVNLFGAFQFCREVIKIMLKQKEGSIINISSVVGVHGNAGQCNYSASKAGLIGLTKSLSKEVAGRRIKVNAVAPGFIETDMTEKLSEKIRDHVKNEIPMKCFGSTKDVAQAILFLASSSSAYITGQVLSVDGGLGI